MVAANEREASTRKAFHEMLFNLQRARLLGTYNRLTACLTQRCPQPTRNNIPKPLNLFYHVKSICLSVYLSVILSANLSIYQPFHLPICQPVYLSFYPSIYLSIYQSTYLSTICITQRCLQITTPLAQNGAPARIFQNSLGEGGLFKLEKASASVEFGRFVNGYRSFTRTGPMHTQQMVPEKVVALNRKHSMGIETCLFEEVA